jgi:hypothetical protein
MIRVTIRRPGGVIRELRVSGHGGGAKGSDVVCAAVSAVSQTALRGLLHFRPEAIRWRREDGFLSIRVEERLSPDEAARLDAILTAAYLGLREIAGLHPDRVSIELVETRERRERG